MIDLRERYPDVTDIDVRVRLVQLSRVLQFHRFTDRYSLLITYDDIDDPADEADSLLEAMTLMVGNEEVMVVDTYFEPIPPVDRFINFLWEGCATNEAYERYDAIYHLIQPDYRDVQAAVQEWEKRLLTDDEAKELANTLFEKEPPHGDDHQ